MKTGENYALIVSVGDYSEQGACNLPSYIGDAQMIRRGFVHGLKIKEDHIRTLGHDGYITMREFARALKEFAYLLRPEDKFLLYFSGHGERSAICFSDGRIGTQQVVEYMDRMTCGGKVLFLDCCYAGGVHAIEQEFDSDDVALDELVGHGTSVLASSSEDSVSRIVAGKNCSLFTDFLATSLLSGHLVRGGRISLADLDELMQISLKIWGEHFPEKKQQVTFRSGMIGTLYFQVEEKPPYEKLQYQWETEEYAVHGIKRMDNEYEKRCAVFVRLKQKDSRESVARIARELSIHLKKLPAEAGRAYTDISVIWFYFGLDHKDMIYHRFCTTAVMATTPETVKKYYTAKKDSHVLDGVWIWENPSYAMLCMLQAGSLDPQEYRKEFGGLLRLVILHMEEFIRDLNEVENGKKPLAYLGQKYHSWFREISISYMRCCDETVDQEDLILWGYGVLDLVSNVLDLAMLAANMKREAAWEGEHWRMRQSIRSYYEALERLCWLEKNLT